MTGIVTAALMPSIISGSDMRETPPSRRMSAGTRSSAMTAVAPASSAMRAWSGVTTSMITPPFNISARPRLTRNVPVWRADGVVAAAAAVRGSAAPELGSFMASQSRGGPGPCRTETPVVVALHRASPWSRVRAAAIVPGVPSGVAQPAEHRTVNPQVVSSSLTPGAGQAPARPSGSRPSPRLTRRPTSGPPPPLGSEGSGARRVPVPAGRPPVTSRPRPTSATPPSLLAAARRSHQLPRHRDRSTAAHRPARHPAARRLPPHRGGRWAGARHRRGRGARLGELALEGRLRRPVAHPLGDNARKPRPRPRPARLGQRRADDPVLPRRRPGDQAGAGRGRATGAASGRTPGDRRGRRHGAARPALHRRQRGRPRGGRLGHPHGHRHRHGGRRHEPARLARRPVAQAVPARAGHRRRHRRHPDHRRLLLRRRRGPRPAHGGGAGGRGGRAPCRRRAGDVGLRARSAPRCGWPCTSPACTPRWRAWSSA